MTRIKFCGITTREDALEAAALGVDMLGFVFYPRSPRCLLPQEAESIRDHLPPSVLCVGVFVEEEAATVRAIAAQCGLDALQFHGSESPEYCREFSEFRIIKAFSAHTAAALERIPAYSVQAILIDAYDPVRIGGTGHRADWTLARAAKQAGPVILAGGLDEHNVKAALATVRPYGLDVSSSIELCPGKKDREKMARFVEKVREFDQVQVPARDLT